MTDAVEESLGETQDVLVERSGVETRIELEGAAVRRVLDGVTRAKKAGAAVARVSLSLDEIRGTLDPSVLTLSLTPVLRDRAAHPEPYRVGSIGLYGLRRASVAPAGGATRGLGYVLDVTPFFDQLATDPDAELDALMLSVRPRHALPDTAPITIGRIRISARYYASDAS